MHNARTSLALLMASQKGSDAHTTDETVEVRGPLSDRPPTEPQGPARRPAAYYAGEHIGAIRMYPADVERNPNGSIPGTRDKAARRVIRRAMLRACSTVEVNINKARAAKRELEELCDTKWEFRRAWKKATRGIVPLEVPDGKQIRAMRTAARKEKRARAKAAKHAEQP